MRRSFDFFFQFDWKLFLAASALTIIGLMTMYAVGIAREATPLFQFKKQLIAAGIGWGLVIAMVFIEYRQLRAFAIPLYVGGLLLLVAVLLFGTTVNGTRGWFVIGNLSFQPVEISKILLSIFLAAYLSRYVHTRLGWVPLIGSALATAIYVGLVLLQPDLGSAAVLIVIWFAAVLLTGLPRRAWLVLLAIIAIGGPLVWKVGLKPYQQARFISFLNPAVDPRGSGYNVAQARIAIGSGGLLGKGIGEGSQSRLRFLPEATSDFIFSVIGEDLGFIGIVVVLMLFGLLCSRLIHIARTARDAFAEILIICLLAFFSFHLLVHAGMNLGIMPVTGIPLPFVSAAASSLIIAFLAVGIAESVAVRKG